MKSTNPKIYWNISNRKSKGETVKASIDDFVNHFKTLSAGEEMYTEAKSISDYDYIPGLNMSTLNGVITEANIRKAVKQLKNNKSGAVDHIVNEYIKRV